MCSVIRFNVRTCCVEFVVDCYPWGRPTHVKWGIVPSGRFEYPHTEAPHYVILYGCTFVIDFCSAHVKSYTVFHAPGNLQNGKFSVETAARTGHCVAVYYNMVNIMYQPVLYYIPPFILYIYIQYITAVVVSVLRTLLFGNW